MKNVKGKVAKLEVYYLVCEEQCFCYPDD